MQTGIGPEGVKSGSVSRAKFDLVKDKLKKVQVGEWTHCLGLTHTSSVERLSSP